MAETGVIAGDTAKGAAKGAVIGSVFGPVGTVVGAVIGGVVGFVQGIFQSKADEARDKANNEMNVEAMRTQAVQRRNIVRDLYQKRASAVAAAASESGGLESSLGQGGVGSIDSQGQFNLGYFDSQIVSGKIVQNYTHKANNYAANVGLIDTAFSVANTASGVFGGGSTGVNSPYSTDNYASSIQPPAGSVNTSDIYTGAGYNSSYDFAPKGSGASASIGTPE